MKIPAHLPPAVIVRLEDRGEVFARVHRHHDPNAPTVLLLHGWTASCDTNWLYAFPTLTERYSVIAVDDRGHGRGIRSPDPFTLEDTADDAAAVAAALRFDRLITVGYSMGGPVSMHLWRRHPELVRGMVFLATALEWSANRRERWRWRGIRALGPVLRSWWFPRAVARSFRRLAAINPDLGPLVPWLTAETLRNDPASMVAAGRAISTYDARSWVKDLSVPTAVVITTEDRLVAPAKQRQMASALRARTLEVATDHLGPLTNPSEVVLALREAIDAVATTPD
jgi:pimeloyl-ACP methyl ester carboxylesterase